MPPESETTGRYLVLLRKEKPADGVRRLKQLAGVRILHSRGRRSRPVVPGEHCAVVFDHIGVALLSCPPQSQVKLAEAAKEQGAILAVEPERRVHANPAGGSDLDAYLRGYRDAVEDLTRRLSNDAMQNAASLVDDTVTWGVRAVAADRSAFTGKGIRVAVLDTGLDLEHPDFAGRTINAQSFIEGQTAQDGNGHGTHCAGIAAGPLTPVEGPRYGVAGEAELHVGKVLSDEGAGADGTVLQGIDWAIENGCHVLSLSLGSAMQPGQGYSAVFEAVAQRALAAGTLIVAAAGNESSRPEYIAPVGHPANCPSILAVGAVDRNLKVAPFSCGGIDSDGGEVDMAAPGVDIHSAWPLPQEHRTISGTSMATPFVAGVAALHAQADPDARGRALGERVLQTVQKLEEPERDVGAGLVQAPSVQTALKP